MTKLKGTGVALVTPFKRNLEIDFDALKKLLDYVSNGVDYLVVQGTTGESPTTSIEEKKALLKFTKDHNPKSLPIVYGIGGNNTEEIIHTIQDTNLEGVEAILSVSPYYNKPSQKALINHYTRIADASPVPVILYNVPGRTGSNITAKTTLELAKLSNVIAIKEASGDMEQIIEIALKKPSDFLLISGDDMLTTAMISLGAIGVISVIANAYPVEYSEIIRSALKGDFLSTKKDQEFLFDLNPLLYKESNPVGVKQVLKELGIIEPYCRLPLLEASAELVQEIKLVLKK